MLRPIRANPSRQPVSTGSSIPAPVGGWDAVSAIADMPEDRALVLENWFPTTVDVRVRRGHQIAGAGMGDGVVDTLMVYNGLTIATSAMFAATGNKFYDVSASGNAVATTETGLANNRWQYINFTTSGGKFLWACNGADAPRHYNGSVWAQPSITGITASDVINVNGHKGRIWLVLRDSTKAAYLPTGAIAGAATTFELGGLFTQGGYLVAMATWTRDGGSGTDDLAVFISSRGQVAELGFAVGGVATGYFDSAKKFYALGALDVAGAFTVAGVAKFPVITADITDAAVTYAKLQDVSAASRILGRKTPGAGDAEECTLSEILDFVGSAANGDILIRSGGVWTRLPKGTDGNALIQASGLPAWGGSPSMFLISSQAASSSSAITFSSGIDATYSQYVVLINAARPSTDGVQFLMEVSVDGGSSWKTSSYLGGPWTTNTNGATTNAASTSFFSLSRASAMSNSASQGWRGYVTIFDPSSTGYKSFNTTGSHLVSGGTIYENVQGGGFYNGVTTAINAIRFRMSSNAIADGTFTLYGIK